MKTVITSYSFNASAGTIDFTSFSGFDVRRLFAVINETRQTLIYAAASSGLGYSSIAGSVITLQYNTSSQSNSDLLTVIYDDPNATVSLSSGTSVSVTQSSASSLNATVIGTGTFATQVTSLPSIPAGSNAIGSVSVSNFPSTQAVSGTVAVSNFPATQPISAASLPLPSGASTSALQSNVQSAPGTPQTMAITVQGNASGVALPVSGSVSVSSLPSIPAGSNAIGSVSVSNFPSTQPVSGTVTANAGTGTFAVSAASLPLPSGAATAAGQTTLGLGTVTINDGANVASVKAASTAAVATDKSLVVALSPNSPIPAGTNAIGSITNTSFQATQATAANLNATVVQSTAASLNATVVGTGTFSVQNTAATPAGSNTIGYVKAAGLAVANAPIYNVYSSTNITTSAYTQLIASTTSATTFVDIFDSSGQAMILAVGASGSEVIQAYIPPGGDAFSLSIPAGSRVAYKALTANATSGYLLLNMRG